MQSEHTAPSRCAVAGHKFGWGRYCLRCSAEKPERETTREQALRRLAAASAELDEAKAEHDARILNAIIVGCSEREIGRAAGMSGSAINQRKKKRL